MLSWQQAAVLAAGLFVAGLLLVSLARAGAQPGRSPGRAARWAAHVGPFAREAGVVTALYALWQLAGNLAAGGLNVALGHAWWIWDTERSLGLPSELAAQLARPGVPADGTARNWATVTRLMALLDAGPEVAVSSEQ